MSIANNFDRSPDAGFTRSFDAELARRQFQLSLVLVLILAVATLMLGVIDPLRYADLRFDQPDQADRD